MPGATPTDDDLIALVASGNPDALADLYSRHGRAIWSVARAFAAAESEVDDIVQETFLAVLQAAHTYRPGGPALPWLYAIARNAGRRTHRRRREVSEPELLELGIEAGWGAPEGSAVRSSDAESLARAIASLDPQDREVLVLRDVEGWSGSETAGVLQLSIAAMKSRLHRARLRLLAVLEGADRGVAAQARNVGGLTCPRVLEALGDYVDGDLDEGLRQQVDDHLRGCSICERFGGRYASVVHDARGRLGASLALDSATFERVRRALLEP